MPYSILVVEDDIDINNLLVGILRKEGYEVTPAYSGTEAKLRLEAGAFHLALLDLMLPGMTGEELIAEVRKTSTIPIIVLSAKTTAHDKVSVLQMGADDFVTKPFDLGEVLARVAAQLRRFHEFSQPQEFAALRFKNLTLDRESVRADIGGEELPLTPREFAILELLMKFPKRVFTRANLFEQIWKDAYLGDDNTVNVHISNLRAKLAKADPDTEYIKTVWGIGFKMAD